MENCTNCANLEHNGNVWKCKENPELFMRLWNLAHLSFETAEEANEAYKELLPFRCWKIKKN